ncbi:MAG: hypothetical protein Q7S21_00085 [archaeon]|nr:hypothetical protein [archaeon]
MARTKIKRMLAFLLDSEYKPVSKYELAKKTGCSPSWSIKLVKKLEKKGLVKNLKVINAKGLFELFHTLQPKKKVSRSYSIYSIESTDKLIELFKKSNKEYAFTTYIAENILQKYLFNHRTEAYIKKEDLEEWHKQLTAIGTYGGGNVRIIVSANDELFNKKIIGKNGPYLVNMPQLISDLYVEGGPAGEAADMLLEKLVKIIEVKK